MKSRFNCFTDLEKEVLRMALRRYYDDLLKAELLGYDPSENSFIASTLVYELVSGL